MAREIREEPAQNEPIQIEPDAERPATILNVAAELERRGAKVVELFKEIDTDRGRTMLPIHLRWRGEDFFVEIETRNWRTSTEKKALHAAAVVRASEYSEAGLGLLSAYPAPEEVNFFFRKSPAALFQLDLYSESSEEPPDLAEAFVRAARRQWDTRLDFSSDSLSVVEEHLTAALGEDPDPEWSGKEPPILRVLVESLGSYLGEVIRRNNSLRKGSWKTAEGWGENLVLEVDEFVLDPIGKARAFLENGAKDSVAYYAGYAIRELEAIVPASETRGQS
ncbi:MAG: hypothetical protein ACFB50_07720 [Rubrobacteraceae bacterium]